MKNSDRIHRYASHMAVRIAAAIVDGVEKAWDAYLDMRRAARAANAGPPHLDAGGVLQIDIRAALVRLFLISDLRADAVIDIMVEGGRIARRDILLFSTRARTHREWDRT